MIQGHVAAFNANMKAERVEAAILENEEIEAMASQAAESIRKRDKPLESDRVDYELKLLKTAIEAAIKNWLALGQHLTITKKYDQARAAYQRVIDTYTGDTELSGTSSSSEAGYRHCQSTTH
jgi:tetratricopeptide (TPR) repeat protein